MRTPVISGNTLWRRLRRTLRSINPLPWPGRMLRALRNRRRMFAKIDYIRIDLPSSLPLLPEARSWLWQRLQGPAPLSLWELRELFDQIAADPRPRGVLLHLDGLSMPLADLQTLRGLIVRLRAAGKRVVTYGQTYDLPGYFLASAADAIYLQPTGELVTLGLRTEVTYLKNALDRIGAALDVVAITPYKGAFDSLSRADVSEEGRAQIDWLLDSRYDQIVAAIAEGRGLTTEAVRTLIDTAPHLDTAAHQRGYVDALVFEEDLPKQLAGATLTDLDTALKRLRLPAPPPRTDTHIAVLPITGLMIPGDSGSNPIDLPIPIPFLGDERAGDRTIVRQIRALAKDDAAAAVIVLVDSGGGAAIAAEAMTSALADLARTRPVIVSMNGVAASGGYLVATAASRIVAQPGTITGSIGVVTAKPVLGGLKDKLRVRSVTFQRGANADLFSEDAPFTDDQRAVMRASIEHNYASFVRRVTAARSLTTEQVDAVGGGRVWTGEQAVEHHLVDDLGDLWTAATIARKTANLPDHTPLVVVHDHGEGWLPPLADTLNPAARWERGVRTVIDIAHTLNGTACYLLPLTITDPQRRR